MSISVNSSYMVKAFIICRDSDYVKPLFPGVVPLFDVPAASRMNIYIYIYTYVYTYISGCPRVDLGQDGFVVFEVQA